MKNLFLWFKYIIVKHEPTLNFGWLKQSTITAFTKVAMRRGQTLSFLPTIEESGEINPTRVSFVVLNSTKTSFTIAKE